MFKRRPLGPKADGGSGSGAGGGDSENAGNRPPPTRPSPHDHAPDNFGNREHGNTIRPPNSAAGSGASGGRRRNRRRGRGGQGQSQGPNNGVNPSGGASGQPAGLANNGAPSGGPQRNQRPQGPRPAQQNRGGQPQGQRNNNNQNNNSRPGQQQGGRQQQGRNQNNRQPLRQPLRRPPPPPPAYLQRGLVLVVTADHAKAIDEVRAKFDPLVKKIPAHVTLLLPEPASRIQNSFLRSLEFKSVPTLESLTFTHVEVKNDRYLFMVPDEDSKGRLRQWNELVVSALGDEHTQDTEYNPRLTLGYIPRSMTPDDAMAFARNLIAFPLTVNFEKIMLEEFEENQLSKQLDALSMSEPLPAEPTAPKAAAPVEAATGPEPETKNEVKTPSTEE